MTTLLTEAERATGPHALLGDFNARPTAPELAPLFQHFRDAWAAGGDGEGFTFPVQEPNARIDFALVSPDLRVDAATVPSQLGSDHLPLVAEVRTA